MKRIVLVLVLMGLSGVAMATTAPQAMESGSAPSASTAVAPVAVTPHQPLIKVQFVLRSPPPVLPDAMDIVLDSSQRGITPLSGFSKSSILLRGGGHDDPNDNGCRQFWGFNCVVW